MVMDARMLEQVKQQKIGGLVPASAQQAGRKEGANRLPRELLAIVEHVRRAATSGSAEAFRKAYENDAMMVLWLIVSMDRRQVVVPSANRSQLKAMFDYIEKWHGAATRHQYAQNYSMIEAARRLAESVLSVHGMPGRETLEELAVFNSYTVMAAYAALTIQLAIEDDVVDQVIQEAIDWYTHAAIEMVAAASMIAAERGMDPFDE